MISKECEGWNKKAKIQNTKSFVSTFHKEPKNYQEVEEWVNSMIAESEKQPLSRGTIEQYDALGLLHDRYKLVGFVQR